MTLTTGTAGAAVRGARTAVGAHPDVEPVGRVRRAPNRCAGARIGTTPAGPAATAANRPAPTGRSPGALHGLLAFAGLGPRGTQPPLKRFEANRRLRLGTAVMLLVFMILGGRLVELQLTDSRAYAAAGLADRLTTTVLPAERGSIVDRYGNVLADSIEARYIFADPSKVVNPTKTASELVDLLALPETQLAYDMRPQKADNGKPLEFVYLKRGVDIGTAQSVLALNLPGIGIGRDQSREEPGHDLASNIIGYVGDGMIGRGGLEAGDDKLLSGTDGSEVYETGDGNLSTRLPGGYDEVKPARPGSSLQLTIDRDLQFEIQQMLYTQMTKVKADWGSAVVLKVGTGEVLAQASYPSFDAANYLNYPPADRGDQASGTIVDPGSVAKLITIAGALQEGVITPDSTETINPSIKKGDTTFYDDTPLPPGSKITIPGILALSSNVGAITVAGQLGPDNLYKYQKLFGFGQSTNEGLPGEEAGILRAPADWSGSSYGSIPIGLGISVTPLQMTAAYAAIANGGEWVQPHIVAATIKPDGTKVASPAPSTHRVVSAQVASEMRTMLEAVTDKAVPGATGTQAALTGYLVAGKTGTSNPPYVPGDTTSFVGMAPADNPQYVIGIFAHVAKGAGGTIAAPTFHDMMTFTLQHYDVPPTGAKEPTFHVTAK
jgi:cell division protein FtsI (penicillin-binding protein 3)